jgi:hypothetical protein
VRSCPDAVLHPRLRRELAEILAAGPAPPAEPAAGWPAAWERWQAGLSKYRVMATGESSDPLGRCR